MCQLVSRCHHNSLDKRKTGFSAAGAVEASTLPRHVSDDAPQAQGPPGQCLLLPEGGLAAARLADDDDGVVAKLAGGAKRSGER